MQRSILYWLLLACPAIVLAAPDANSKQAPLKLTQAQILEKLRALGAGIWMKNHKGEVIEVKPDTLIAGEKLTFSRVEFRAEISDGKPLAAADYAILDSLTDLPELSLSGEQVDDAVVERLRPFRALTYLVLDQAKITAPSYNVLPTLPELHELYLSGTGASDAAFQTIVQCRKLKNLHLVNLPISDAGLASLGKLTALEELELNELDQLGSPGFAHLADCHALKTIYVGGFTILSGMVENIARCKNLENVTLPGTVLKDADIASLSALTKLRTLNLEGSSVTGTAFATWPMRLFMTSLNLDKAAGMDDAILKNIARAFPKLEELNVTIAPTGFTVAGASAIAKLHGLHTLRIAGAGVTDEIAVQLAHCDGLTTLAIPAAQLSDKGITAFTKVPHLEELGIDLPPITDAALKALSRCKEIKTINIGKNAPPETEPKLRQALPIVVVNRPTE